MNRWKSVVRRAPLCALLFLLVLPTLVSAGGLSPRQTPEVDPVPPEIAQFQNEWPLSNHDFANTRAATDSAIDSSTVKGLALAWTFDIPGLGQNGAAASALLIANGVVYFQDLQSNVFALDLKTGKPIWQHLYNHPVAGPNGIGLGYGKIFGASSDHTFAALDLKTGNELWSVTTENPTGAIQPYAYDGLVYLTTQSETTTDSYAGGRSGHIIALNQETGATAWDFQVVASDFWGDPKLNGGGGVFFPPAIDTQSGLTFWGTGNPVPFPGTVDAPNASSRPGNNPNSDSLVTLDHATGKLTWATQVKAHDLFGLDFQLSPILAQVTIDGSPRDVVIGAGKLGRVVAFDRASGDILWNTAVGKHENDDLATIPDGQTITVFPGGRGGGEAPFAYADSSVYVAMNDLGSQFTSTGFDAKTPAEAAANIDDHTSPGTGTSFVDAIDAATGKVKWTHNFTIDDYGGTTVVGDLVFTSTLDGVIHALDRETGNEVWSYQASVGITAWPAVAGDTLIVAAGAGEKPQLLALRLPTSSS